MGSLNRDALIVKELKRVNFRGSCDVYES